jgi:protein SCO1/2
VKYLAALAAALVFLAGCGPSGPSFRNVDITGADFGKDFALTDHTGKPRTLADFRGKVVVMFFGYTRCPDVCPSTLAELKQVLGKLGDNASRVQVLFITVDPERDTQALLAQYVPAFDPGFLGLHGDLGATAKVAREFKVFYQKVPGSKPDNYTMDHTAASYVFDAQGRLRLLVKHGSGGEALVQDLKTLLTAAN